MDSDQICEKIRNGEIDINNQSLFFGILTKGLLWKLRQDITIRGEIVPHFIPHTGDETMFVEIKGKDVVKDPTVITNEDYIYTQVPRCAVQPKNISLQLDQLTSPYSRGQFQYDDGDTICTFNAEFRRMPMVMNFDLTYLVDSYTDFLELCQQIITKLSVIRMFKITYMGQSIDCSYKIPDNLDGESNLDFDLNTTEDKRRKMSLSIEVETNMPIFFDRTVITTDKFIRHVDSYDIRLYDKGHLNEGDGEDPKK